MLTLKDLLPNTRKGMWETPRGEHLDEMVAVHLMGYGSLAKPEEVEVDGKVRLVHWTDPEGNPAPIPPYSTDMGHAWRVVEKLEEEGWRLALTPSGEGVTVRFTRSDGCATEQVEVRGGFPERFTVPETLCRCALLLRLRD